MLDIILIQHITGISLLEYRLKHTKLNKNHSDIFSGFLSAIQNITQELNIGSVILISTQGEKGHNCIIINKDPIRVILLVDETDPISVWRETGEIIIEKFLEMYTNTKNYNQVTQFENFKSILQNICKSHSYCGEK